MGMYTGYKAQATLKNKFNSIMKDVIKNQDLSLLKPFLNKEENQVLDNFLSLERSSQIFSVVGDTTFNSFDTNLSWDLEEDGPTRVDGETLFVFSSLKNYNREINIFTSNILPLICSEINEAQLWFCEVDTPLDLLRS